MDHRLRPHAARGCAAAELQRQPEPSGPVEKLLGLGARPVYTTLATDSLDGHDVEMMRRHLGNVDGNLSVGYVEAAFSHAGLRVERKDAVGTEWREHAEERTQPASLALLRLSRLRRQQDELIGRYGEDIYSHIEANLHWEVFQLLGKLEPVVYVLRRA